MSHEALRKEVSRNESTRRVAANETTDERLIDFRVSPTDVTTLPTAEPRIPIPPTPLAPGFGPVDPSSVRPEQLAVANQILEGSKLELLDDQALPAAHSARAGLADLSPEQNQTIKEIFATTDYDQNLARISPPPGTRMPDSKRPSQPDISLAEAELVPTTNPSSSTSTSGTQFDNGRKAPTEAPKPGFLKSIFG